MPEEEWLLTMDDEKRLAPVIRGEYPTQSALVVVEQILREHLGRMLQKDLT